ncbi:MAG: biotin/lipoyl-containing protein, partial [Reinekea sp.]|nr:biotin/lipoyl-containing protein [Reinekea sp.]
MAIEIKAPQFPESVADGTIATWHKQPGEPVSRDELLVDIETDKVVLEVVAPADGSLAEILKGEGDTVLSQELIAQFVEGDVAQAAPSSSEGEAVSSPAATSDETPMSPAARKIADEANLSAGDIVGTGKGGRITKEDVVKAAANKSSAPAAPA